MTTATIERTPRTLARRLVPLQIGVAIQTFMLWTPIEKLFLTQIGFTAATIGIMSAAYALVTPLLEIPSGILADRRSRSALLIAASIALAGSEAVGALSHGVATYIVSAMILGAYFAMNSGTVDSIVYDAVLEETGSSSVYEKVIGRIRMIEAASLSTSAVLGGLLAGWTSPRTTYWLSVPLALASVIAFLVLDEPTLHRQAEPTPLREHIATTFRVMTREPSVRKVMLLAALTATLQQTIFEFGPLWLVADAAPAAAYGPYWALLVGSLGVGGFLVSRIHLERRRNLAVLAALVVVAPLALAFTDALGPVIAAQTVLLVLLSTVGIRAGLLVHDAVASNVRAGVSSGVGTLSWVLFLPFSLLVGWLTRAYGVGWAGWVVSGTAAVVAALLLRPGRPDAVTDIAPAPGESLDLGEANEIADLDRVPAGDLPPLPTDVACRELVQLVTDYLDGALPTQWRTGLDEHLAGCDGCAGYLQQMRDVIDAVERLGSDLGNGMIAIPNTGGQS